MCDTCIPARCTALNMLKVLEIRRSTMTDRLANENGRLADQYTILDLPDEKVRHIRATDHGPTAIPAAW